MAEQPRYGNILPYEIDPSVIPTLTPPVPDSQGNYDPAQFFVSAFVLRLLYEGLNMRFVRERVPDPQGLKNNGGDPNGVPLVDLQINVRLRDVLQYRPVELNLPIRFAAKFADDQDPYDVTPLLP